VAITAIGSLRKTADAEILVVDDGSPRSDLVDALEAATAELEVEVHRKDENSGFASTVNVGLARARDEGRDAVLVNADVEFFQDGWLDRMVRQERSDGEGLASVVGARLLYPNGLIQHAGVYFSILTRSFGHIYQYGPGDLPEAMWARRCPVTAALQFIRHECIEAVGLYDEQFQHGLRGRRLLHPRVQVGPRVRLPAEGPRVPPRVAVPRPPVAEAGGLAGPIARSDTCASTAAENFAEWVPVQSYERPSPRPARLARSDHR
jgi:glycosyltransferase involved in cell wall biosynthesis